MRDLGFFPDTLLVIRAHCGYGLAVGAACFPTGIVDGEAAGHIVPLAPEPQDRKGP